MAINNSICKDCVKSDVCSIKTCVQDVEYRMDDLLHHLVITSEGKVKPTDGFSKVYDLPNKGINYKVTCVWRKDCREVL